VQRIEEGRGVEVKDVFEGDTFFVNDVNSSRAASQWDCLISRIHRFEDKWLFVGNGLLVPRPLLGAIRESVDAGRRKERVSAGEFFRSCSHEWRRFVLEEHEERFRNLRLANTEGDPIEFSSAEYEAPDAEAVASALSGDPAIEEITEAGAPAGT